MELSARYLGIDIGGTTVKVGLLESSGVLQCATKVPTKPEDGPRELIRRAMSAGRNLAKEFGVAWADVESIGVGCAGLISSRRGGLLITSPNLAGWDDQPLGGMLKEAAGEIDVFLDNDANAFAYAEARVGAAAGMSFGVFLTLGTGVGGGLLIDGAIYRGCEGLGAELGHIVLDPGGPVCECGNRGCLESFVRSRTIVETAIARYTSAGKAEELRRIGGGDLAGVTPERLCEAASSGDDLAVGVFLETGRWLGIAVGGLINEFNPQVVVIGGGVAQAGEYLMEPVRHWAGRYAFAESLKSAKILSATLKENAGLIGAALEARDRCGIPCR
jgi:glucokinase